MISRYALYNIADLSKRFLISAGLPKGVKPHYNISPTVGAPVIISEKGSLAVKLMKWGLVTKGAKDTNSVFRYKTYNIPSESIFTRHSWDLAVRESRCLVPANGFYELSGSDKKRAHYAELKDKSLLALAGVYSSWQDSEGIEHGTYSVITAGSSYDMPDSSSRVPIIIRPKDEARWLDPAVTDDNSLYEMLRPNPSDLLNVYEVSPAVHSPKLNQASLIEHI